MPSTSSLGLHLRAVGHLGCVVLAVASCQDAVSPDSKVASLSAVSPTRVSGTVGAAVDEPPSVVVRDAHGKAVPGVVVTFSPRGGGGWIQMPRATSNATGIARVGVWMLGTSLGLNSIVATTTAGDSVVFLADAVAGAPFQLQKVGGDGQTAVPGATLGFRPRVRVVDTFGNPVAGVPVTFIVEVGGGSVSGTPATSDASGIAESGEWVLGSPGLQRLVAHVGQLASLPFTARAVVPPFTCTPYVGLPVGASFQSELTPLSCTGADGRPLESYTIVVTEPNAYVFTAASADFNAQLELRDARLVDVATNTRSGMTNAPIKALLGPGTYTLTVSSSKLGATGKYDVSYALADKTANRCEDVYLARGLTARGVVETSDCTVSPSELADRFIIYLEAGSAIEVVVADFSYSGANVEISGPDGESERATPGAGYLTKLAYTARVDGYHTVLVGLLDEPGVQYEITVH